MKIVVCVKQVVTLGDDVEFMADQHDVQMDDVDRSLNEWDAAATEEALKIRERAGDGQVVVVTFGDESAVAALRRCLAMGVDRAIWILQATTGPVDPLTTAYALAEAVRLEEPDLVLCGVQSSDSVQGSTGTALAELLGLPRVAVVTKIGYEPGDRRAIVNRELEGGLIDVVEVDLPALLTIQTGINQPRYVTLRAIKLAEKQEIEERLPNRLGEGGFRIRRMFAPSQGEGAQILEGTPAAIAQQIKNIIEEKLR